MSAKVNNKFRKGFEISEESIRRIYADLKKRVPAENHADIIFEVFREDSLVYRTAEVDRVLTEDNDSTRKIKSLRFLYVDNSLNIILAFDAEKGVEMTVEGEDRVTVYLISSELREYIDKEVAFIYDFDKLISPKMIPFYFIVIMTAFIFILQRAVPEQTNVEALLNSNDLNEKLNYLISATPKTKNIDRTTYIPILIPMLVMLCILLPAEKLIGYFIPSNIFLIGKQITIIRNRRGTTKNIFWSGLVALVIALASGYYFWWLPK